MTLLASANMAGITMAARAAFLSEANPGSAISG